jgi:acetyl-CoA C-acetyltransferase
VPLNVSILAACRTPIGSFQGALASCSASDLGATAIRGVLATPGPAVDEVFMGQVLQAGSGQAPARQAALAAGLPDSVRTATINRVCGSGLEAVRFACHSLALEASGSVIAGGMEAMSRAPYLLPEARSGHRLGHRQAVDSLIHDGLWDPHGDRHMGLCAEATAERYGFSREDQDAYAAESFRRANRQIEANGFADEVVPVTVTGPRGVTSEVRSDEGPARVRYDKIPQLRPAFAEKGTITAANASTLNDGAAALWLARPGFASDDGAQPIGRIVAFGSHAQDPTWFTTAPVQAAQTALAEAGWAVGEVDLWEVNEAFAVVPLAFMRELGLDPACVNVRGGAIALGHPIGCSGARIVVTLLAALRERRLRRGVAAICIGGGEGLAVCVEVDPSR